MIKMSELILNLVLDYPRIPARFVANALGISKQGANYHLNKWLEAGIISAYRAGAHPNFERVYFFTESMPDEFVVETLRSVEGDDAED